MSKLPDLSRTALAIEAYDAWDATFDEQSDQEAVMAWFARLEELGEAVGYAFGLDTADRNSVSTCKATIRPGHKTPGPGFEKSWVRRKVDEWRRATAS